MSKISYEGQKGCKKLSSFFKEKEKEEEEKKSCEVPDETKEEKE